ncbi:SixA phosphatase family protein [Streptomyces sp. NPDC091292]|uniref:SixA phosphatase family protein n=1 Tax=Streptomyces sp. NPDC091292 TaxID=3365991 RepID=UPI0037F15140
MSGSAPARLIVLRHAKSAWPEEMADHDRPLARRGRRDAPAAGRWLRTADNVPDLVICSTAQRTRETWELAAPELDATPEVVFESRVYGASGPELAQVLRATPESRRTVLLIGHQPGVQELVLSLAGGGDAVALDGARGKFPTSAIAVLALPSTWARLAPGTAALTAFAIPRGLATGH